MGWAERLGPFFWTKLAGIKPAKLWSGQGLCYVAEKALRNLMPERVRLWGLSIHPWPLCTGSKIFRRWLTLQLSVLQQAKYSLWGGSADQFRLDRQETMLRLHRQMFRLQPNINAFIVHKARWLHVPCTMELVYRPCRWSRWAHLFSVASSYHVIDDRIPTIIRELLDEAQGCLKSNFHWSICMCTKNCLWTCPTAESWRR